MALDVQELMAKVGKIRILTNRLVDESLSGDYHSTFKGQGVEFDEVRPYVVGDDVRTIDWNVTARTGTPFIKRFSEERELTVVFMVDVSGSQDYGTAGRTKAELAAEVTALLALTALRNQDKIGLILFSGRIVKFIPPNKGRQSVMRLVREVLSSADEATGGTDIAEALKFLGGVFKRRGVVFLVSDFKDSSSTWERELKTAARHHDLVCFDIHDAAELSLPNCGLVEIEDPETGDLALVDTADAKVREAFNAAAADDARRREELFARNGIDTVSLSTGEEYIHKIRALFKRRALRR
ncbi:MAG: DUF58 domain-containing protein [Kiritimatiellae bacterium]|nr:DUF58 domain-containing protein [Kiritimatiellia bacterium]